MLSCMETQQGLMVIGPKGQSLRLASSHPAYRAGREIVHMPLPAEQAWQKLQDLMANPLKALVDWFERFGFVFTAHGDTVHVNDRAFSQERWLPLFNRAQSAGASPHHLVQFAEKLGGPAENALVRDICLHLQEDKLNGLQPALLRLVSLPVAARRGDVVTPSSSGPVPFLVSFADFSVLPSGLLQTGNGLVLSQGHNEKEAADILEQPVILGFDRTYRCEEGTATGWLEDLSFDSLRSARLNAKEIQATGAEARIINRITNETVSLL
jgi:hypothetical protein